MIPVSGHHTEANNTKIYIKFTKYQTTLCSLLLLIHFKKQLVFLLLALTYMQYLDMAIIYISRQLCILKSHKKILLGILIYISCLKCI